MCSVRRRKVLSRLATDLQSLRDDIGQAEGELDNLRAKIGRAERGLRDITAAKGREDENLALVRRAAVAEKNERLAEVRELVRTRVESAQSELAALETLAREVVERPAVAGTRLGTLLRDAYELRADADAWRLENKRSPALAAAEQVRIYGRMLADATARTADLAGDLAYYELLFPWLADVLPDESDIVDNETRQFSEDPASKFLSVDEWNKLASHERSQLALVRWLAGKRSNREIGADYERYVGWLRECAGAKVIYHGIIEGFDDLGRDLIVESPDGQVEIVQCKRWAQRKTIHENHLFQLAGTVVAARLERPGTLVSATFVTTTTLSARARGFADMLSITVLDNFAAGDFPRIKCNVARNDERIYHLPFDQQYANTLTHQSGECTVFTALEAEQRGFRRARRWRSEIASPRHSD